MALSSVIGQTFAKSRLGTLFSGDPGHAYVFTGPFGIGKKTLAREVAQALLCRHPGRDGACGICPDCVYFREGTHPDFRAIGVGADDKNIKVAEIRAKICGDVSIYPQIASRKVYLIDGDGLNEEGQNALLKTLEEPPSYAVFLLTVTDQAMLLPTIISRSVVVALTPNTEEELLSILRHSAGISGPDATFYARYANGIPGQALYLARSPWFSELRDDTLEMLLTIPQKTRTQLLVDDYAFLESEKDHLDEILTILSLALRDMAFLACDPNTKSLLNADKKDKITHILNQNQVDIYRIRRASEAVSTAARSIKANCSFESTACRMLLAIHKELTYA